MADLVINPAGIYTDYFIVSHDGGSYAVPEAGADLALRLRGRVPSRYAPGGMDGNIAVGADEEGVVVVHRFVARGERADSLLHFEGFVRRAGEGLHAHGVLVFGSIEMPAGVVALLGYEGLGPENRRNLKAMPSPPLGMLRMS